MRRHVMLDTINRLIREVSQASNRYALHVDVPEAHDHRGRHQVNEEIRAWTKDLTLIMNLLKNHRSKAGFRNYQLNASKLAREDRHLKATSQRDIDSLDEVLQRARIAAELLAGYIIRRRKLSDFERDSLVIDLITEFGEQHDQIAELVQGLHTGAYSSVSTVVEISPVVKTPDVPKMPAGSATDPLLVFYLTVRVIQLVVKRSRNG